MQGGRASVAPNSESDSQPRHWFGALDVNLALNKTVSKYDLPLANPFSFRSGEDDVGLESIEVVPHFIVFIPSLYAKSLIAGEKLLNLAKS